MPGAAFSGAATGLTFTPSRTSSLGLTASRWPSCETGEHFEAVAEVAAQLNAREVNRAIGLHHGHLRSVAAHDQRVAGDEQRRVLAGHGEIHLGEHAGHQGAVRILHLDFGEQGAGGGVERVGGASDHSVELAAGDFGDRDDGALAHLHGLRVGLREVDVGAQGSGLRDAEEQRAALVDQRAGVHIAQGDHAVEGRAHGLIGLDLIQPGEVGFGGGDGAAHGGGGLAERLHVGLLRGVLRLRVVVILFGDDSAAQQVGHAAGGEARQVLIGAALLDGRFGLLHAALDLIDGGVGLQDLLIEFRGFDFGHHLPGLHAVADIDVAFADVAGGAGQNGGLGHGLNVARKDELAIARGARHAADVDHGESGAGLLRFRGEDRFAPLPGKIAHEKAHHNQDGQQQSDQHQADGGGAPIRVAARAWQMSSALPIAASGLQFRTAAGLR